MNGGVETALVIGATSDIGRAIAHALAEDGCALQLAARDPARLEREARDLRVRTGVAVTAHRCDVLDEDGGVSLLDTLDPLPDVAVCVVGRLGDQAESQRDGAAAERVMRTNYVGPALLMGALAERFEQRGGGVLVGVSSVAGERGRAANYVYGSAKAGFTAFLSGLRGRLAASGVHVVTVQPGFVRTRNAAIPVPAVPRCSRLRRRQAPGPGSEPVRSVASRSSSDAPRPCATGSLLVGFTPSLQAHLSLDKTLSNEGVSSGWRCEKSGGSVPCLTYSSTEVSAFQTTCPESGMYWPVRIRVMG